MKRRVTAALLFSAISAVTHGDEARMNFDQATAPADRLAEVHSSLESLRAFEPVPAMALRDLFYPPSGRSRTAGEERVESTLFAREPVAAEAPEIVIHAPPKLVGVAIKSTGREAYFLKDDKAYTVREGGRLTERYSVERIEPKRIRLRDSATGLSRMIDWDGNEQ